MNYDVAAVWPNLYLAALSVVPQIVVTFGPSSYLASIDNYVLDVRYLSASSSSGGFTVPTTGQIYPLTY